MSEVGALTRVFPGWSLTELKALTRRERLHWLKYGAWRLERTGA